MHLLVQNEKLDHSFLEYLFWGGITFSQKSLLSVDKSPPVCSFQWKGTVWNQPFFSKFYSWGKKKKKCKSKGWSSLERRQGTCKQEKYFVLWWAHLLVCVCTVHVDKWAASTRGCLNALLSKGSPKLHFCPLFIRNPWLRFTLEGSLRKFVVSSW